MAPESPLGPADERRLLGALASGDRSAAEILAQQNYRALFAALLKLSGDAELAADLTQETFRRAWASLPSFKGDARFGTWLYRIAFNAFMSHQRRPRRVEPLAPDQPETPARASSPHRELEVAQAADQLRRAVKALPEPLQLTVTARFWGDITVNELARLEGVSVTAIRKRLRRAETLLRGALQEEDR